MPGRHPDDDLLADLAADVLPVEQARQVEAHVLACDRCASLLSDAEHVRGLLLADDAGPVPPEIWTRIEAALQASSASPTSHVSPEEGAALPPPPPPAPAHRRVEATGPGGWDGPDPLDDPDDWAAAGRPAVASEARPKPGGATHGVPRLSTSRRDARPERRQRPASLLLAAAAAVVLILAVGAVRIAQSGGAPTAAFDSGGASAGSSAASAAAGVAAAAVITRSNKDYTSSTLADGARSLVRQSTLTKMGAVGAEGSSSDANRAPEPRAATTAPAVPPDPKATDVTNPQRLAACLTALGASSDSVVAVDLARYRGREAAVLVVRTSSGYEVWVVERTCSAGDEGALAETTLAS